MEQKEFTGYIISRITDRFPQFKNSCTTKANEVVDIDFKSRNGKLTLWLTTQDQEVTIGFTGDQECDWHTHMSLFNAYTPEEELLTAIDLIENILSDKEVILHSSLSGYFLADNIENVMNQKMKDEVIVTAYWGDL